MRNILIKAICLVVLLIGVIIAAQWRSKPPVATAPATTSNLPGQPRIVSAVPAATLNLVLIGAADSLVGVTPFDQDILPPAQKNLPQVGDYQTMNYEALIQLKPTAVVIQKAEHRIEPRLRELADHYHFELVNIKFDTLEDLYATALRLGKISGHENDARLKIDMAKAELAEIARQVSTRKKPKVLYIVGSNPMMIVGGHCFLDEQIAAAGGENVGAKIGELWPTIGQEALAELSPEVILLGVPGESAQVADDPRVAPYLRLPVPAAKSGRVLIVNDPNAQQASLDIGRQVRRLAELIYAGTPGRISDTAPATLPR